MQRSSLKNKANKSGKAEDKWVYNIQQHKVSKLNKLKKTSFNEKPPKGNKVKDFWNYCKSYFPNNGICNDETIILLENYGILNKDSDISEIFNNYFILLILQKIWEYSTGLMTLQTVRIFSH